MGKKKKHLSPSSITQYLKCSAQYMFKNLIGPKPPTIALLYGKSVDSALNTNLEQKINSREDLSEDEIKDAFVTEWDSNKDTTRFFNTDKPDELRETGIKSVGLWRNEVAENIQPVSVQEKLAIEFEDFNYDILQFADVITEDKTIIDNKTAGRSVSVNKLSKELIVPHDHRLQLTMYDIGYQANHKEQADSLGLDYLIKTKTPKFQSVRWKPNEEDRSYIVNLMKVVANCVDKEVFMPNRNNMMCSRRFCAYWRECQEQYGGKVKK